MKTPGFDYVAERGTRYARAYCPSAICTPSRASLMTGQYVARHGIWNVGVNAGADAEFLSHRLSRVGYQTRLIGKAHYEAYGAPPDQSRESLVGHRQGYGGWTGPYYGFETVELAMGHTVWGLAGHYGQWLRSQANATDVTRYEALVSADGAREFGGNAYDWALPTRLTNSVWTANRTVAFLEDERDKERPFFLFVGFQDPHHPHAVPTDYSGRVDPEIVPLPSRSEDDLDSMPPHYRLALEGRLKGSEFARHWPVSGQHDGFDYRNIPEVSQRMARSYYYSLVQLIDQQLLRIWASLEATGLADNTLVFVTSDHGELLGDHGLWMKGPFHYEQLVRVPMLAMGPGIATGHATDDLVSVVDIAPTCLAAAGVDYGRNDADGINLGGEARGSKDTVLCETILDWDGLIGRTVIGQISKMTFYANATYGEVFDLSSDPAEQTNLWSEPMGMSLRTDMLGALANHDTRMQTSRKNRIAYA